MSSMMNDIIGNHIVHENNVVVFFSLRTGTLHFIRFKWSVPVFIMLPFSLFLSNWASDQSYSFTWQKTIDRKVIVKNTFIMKVRKTGCCFLETLLTRKTKTGHIWCYAQSAEFEEPTTQARLSTTRGWTMNIMNGLFRHSSLWTKWPGKHGHKRWSENPVV